MNSSGTNHVPNKHEDVDQLWPICNTIWDNAMLKLSWKFGESKWNPCWLITLKSSTGTNHVPNEHEVFDQYGPFIVPSKIMPYRSHHASLVDLLDKLIELSCKRGWWEQRDRWTDAGDDSNPFRPKRLRVKNLAYMYTRDGCCEMKCWVLGHFCT